MKKWIGILSLIIMTILLYTEYLPAGAAGKQTIYNSPYVSFSPDGQAWTTNAEDTACEWYAEGTVVSTGISSSLRPPGVGEHYYKIERLGEVPVGKWEVVYRPGSCIHNGYPSEDEDYHGIEYGRKACREKYYSAWNPYCADCGEKVFSFLMYMSKSAAQSIDYLTLGEHDYYYLCPYCTNLEMGTPIGAHRCNAISPNCYEIRYDKNHSEAAGYMGNSTHMYNDAVAYEGKRVTPVTHLSRNSYSCIGYEFTGWNTKPDGSGTSFSDGQRVRNLSSEDGDVVVLYAQWRPSESTLKVDPNGGTYGGRATVTSVVKKYGEQYDLNEQAVKAPAGNTVTFVTNGGTKVSPITGTQHFVEWMMARPFNGRLVDTKYDYIAPDGNTDTVTAVYERDSILLPGCSRAGYSFGGWYYDSNFALPAGTKGEKIRPQKNIVLYAQWVDLRLLSEDNYVANGRKGAVDLSWSQADGKNKTYQIFQSRDLSSWTRVNAAQDISNNLKVKEVYDYSGDQKKYTVPYTGLYTLSASGAQGGKYGSHKGGLGGSVTGTFWLLQGEVITCTVGGQNGYNGGGTATAYGNGGGSTVISSNKKGKLLIAGGGGGASPGGNGGAGGSDASVTSGTKGQKGMAGGGGGYRGGSAGEEIVHNHVEGVCNHKHTGKPSRRGGCYTVPVPCEEELEHELIRTDRWKWGGLDEEYCPNCGATASKGETCSGHEVSYYNHVCPIHGNREENTDESSPEYCDATASYALGCGMTEEYFCKYPYDGYVISSKPAYGGSNYVSSAAYDFETNAGVRKGDGICSITSKAVGFLDVLRLSGVLATDRAAPGRVINAGRTALPGNRVAIRWEEPEDAGTVYYHYAASYLIGSTTPLCESNVVQNTLISGVKGYYILVDTDPNTIVTAKNGIYQVNREKVVAVDGGKRYFHVAAVDVADNVGATVHLEIGAEAKTAWELYTRQMVLAEGDNVYPAGEQGSYYVRSDGKTPFLLRAESYLDGIAREDYQINYSVFESLCENEEARDVIQTSCHAISDGEIRTEAEELDYFTEGKTLLKRYPYAYTVRSSQNRNLTAVQMYTLPEEASGRRIELIPRAGAEMGELVVWSEKEKDRDNGITLIGDGEAPVIKGLESLGDKKTLNRMDGEVILEITAEDALSGLKELSVTIRNRDNFTEATYLMDEKCRVRVDITEDLPLFSGDFLVIVTAVDNVGNVREETAEIMEFALTAEVKRILTPHLPVFKCGESGILTIRVWGYADRVEVMFPEEMSTLAPGLNRSYFYMDFPQYVQHEKLLFTVPLYTPEDKQYPIAVRAYKKDKMLEVYPALSTIGVEGTVLDEIRTRLR